MKLLSLPTVVALSLVATVAAADDTARKAPTPPPPPSTDTPPASCGMTGDIAFEIDHGAMPHTGPTSQLKIYAAGGWTYSSADKDGVAGLGGQSCLDDKTVAHIRELIASAAWTTTDVIHCMIATNASTAYLANGKVLFTDRVCNSRKLDDKSAKALAELEQITAALRPAKPPCCKP